MQTKKQLFITETTDNNCLRCIAHPDDPYQMNWIEGIHAVGETVHPKQLTVTRDQWMENDRLFLKITFTNATQKDFFASAHTVGVYIPFNDSYPGAELCMTNRCHAHIWCGGESSYILGLRMGGSAPHLGMQLISGSLETYSITDNEKNDRGDFLLHPSPFHLLPEKSYELTLAFFWHNGREDFYRILKDTPRYIHVSANHFTAFEGETVALCIQIQKEIQTCTVIVHGKEIPYQRHGRQIYCNLPTSHYEKGEHRIDITVNGISTFCNVFVSAAPDTILEARCRFIATKQQYHNPNSMLDGSYLTYDNQTGCLIYNGFFHDHNAARERIGMAVLIAMYLRSHKNDTLRASLNHYVQFFLREIFDAETGTVFNDAGKSIKPNRRYNYPWAVKLFLELYLLDGKREYLQDAYRVLKAYYALNGHCFYAFTIPILQVAVCFRQENMENELQEVIGYFRTHAETMIQNAEHYPSHEVAYEQSIVAPAAKFLTEMYSLTGEQRYLSEAKKQIEILELFSGSQPDHHLYACAIRHWDDYWFGKSRLLGDTFHHYWNVLSADAFYAYAKASGEASYLEKANDAYRVQFSLFDETGNASCAMVYPFTVNGTPAHFYDAWANDQDWALIYYLDFEYRKEDRIKGTWIVKKRSYCYHRWRCMDTKRSRKRS